MPEPITPDLITPELVALDADLGADKAAVVQRLAALVADSGRATSADALRTDAMAREAQAATGLPGGIAIPHCRSASVTTPSLAFARLAPKVDFGAPDGPADLVFLIAAPAHGDADHLTLLTALARALVRPEFVASLRAASSDDEIVRLVDEAALAGDPAALLAAVRRLHDRGVREVLLTLGADGALLSTADGGVWSAHPPSITVRSTVGAGDSSLAGYLLADLAGAAPGERLRAAVAYGAASASLPGSAVPTPAQVDGSAVRVTAGPPGSTAPVPAAGRDVR